MCKDHNASLVEQQYRKRTSPEQDAPATFARGTPEKKKKKKKTSATKVVDAAPARQFTPPRAPTPPRQETLPSTSPVRQESATAVIVPSACIEQEAVEAEYNALEKEQVAALQPPSSEVRYFSPARTMTKRRHHNCLCSIKYSACEC